MPWDGAEVVRQAGRIRSEIDAAAMGRRVTFCAACKSQSIPVIRAAAATSIDCFGENRAQELVRNYEAGAYGDKPVHFIGHLQSRKVRDVVGRAALIHSVDSLRLLEFIDREAQGLNIVQQVLIEINIAGEAAKSGIAPDHLAEMLALAGQYAHIRVRGIMSIPPAGVLIGETIQYFENLSNLFIDIKTKTYDNVSMDILSMGMSADYQAAVSRGATLVRVGSALFGSREHI